MKRSIFLSILASAVVGISGAAHAQMKPEYFELKDKQVVEIPVEQSDFGIFDQPGLGQNCEGSTSLNKMDAPPNSPAQANPLGELEIVVDQIINIGKKIWAVVEAGRPVINLKMDTANALPKGLQCWVDLEGWHAPQTKLYRVTYQNAYGLNVVEFTYRVSATAGGNLNGVGAYITNATMQAANLEVAWGFTFNATANVPSVFNTKTKADPVAGMQMNMQWSVDTALKHIQSADSFFADGNGILKKLD